MKQETNAEGKKFTCNSCHGEFYSNRVEQEALTEYEETFSERAKKTQEKCIMCSDCYLKFKIWFNLLTLEDHERIYEDHVNQNNNFGYKV